MLTAWRISLTFYWVETEAYGIEFWIEAVVFMSSFFKKSDGVNVSIFVGVARRGDGVTNESGDTVGIGTIDGGAGI